MSHYYSREGAGIGVVARELARGLAASGVCVTWAATSPVPDEPIAGVSYLPMRPATRLGHSPAFPFPLWQRDSLARLRGVLPHIDAVHLHDCLYPGNLSAFHAARRTALPILITQHIGAIPYRSPLLRALLALANRLVVAPLLARADACVFVSEKVRQYFQRFVPFSREPLFVPNGVDHAVFHPCSEQERSRLKSELGWSADRPTVLFVGRFVEKKGMPALRHAATCLPWADWVFVGWGPEDPASWALPQVRSLGQLGPGDVARCYRAADLLVLPSVGEGFPLVVQEAMACGTPCVISSDTALGMPGIERVTSTASHEPDDFAHAVEVALAAPSRLIERRAEVADYARREWRWDVCVDRYLATLSGIAMARTSTGV